MRRPFFKSQTAAWAVGAAFIVAGSWCFHDAFTRRGAKPHWLLKTVTPGM